MLIPSFVDLINIQGRAEDTHVFQIASTQQRVGVLTFGGSKTVPFRCYGVLERSKSRICCGAVAFGNNDSVVRYFVIMI